MNEINIESAVLMASKVFEKSDAEFFERVWSKNLKVYENRLKSIRFEDHQNVLDAGFGMGQWLACLAKLNNFVHGVEYSEVRCEGVEVLLDNLNIDNVSLSNQSIESLDFENNFFDAIFCYGVIFLTDFKKSLLELYRVLKPGGKLYFTANDLGWFIYCIIEEHNKSANYDPRQMAIDTLEKSFEYYYNNKFQPGKQLVIPKNIMLDTLDTIGFKNTLINTEGGINLKGNQVNSFYRMNSYRGLPFIYEVLTEK